MKKQHASRFLVADPKVCHGKLTFRGTRIMVSQVLELLSMEMSWDDIIKECHGRITRAAIAEAILIADRAILEHGGEYVERPVAV